MIKQLAFVIFSVLTTLLIAILKIVIVPVIAFGALLCGNWTLALAMCELTVIAFGELSAPFVVPFIITHKASPDAPTVLWAIYNTLDDPFHNQGSVVGKTFEAQVKAVEDALGWRWKTYYWLAARNPCYGLANMFRPDYDFGTIVFTSSGPEQGVQVITAAWKAGKVQEYRSFLTLGSKKLVLSIGYKLKEAYLTATYPEVGVSTTIDTNPKTDVGGIPYLTIKIASV